MASTAASSDKKWLQAAPLTKNKNTKKVRSTKETYISTNKFNRSIQKLYGSIKKTIDPRKKI